MAKIQGRCTNIGKPCPKATNKEIIEADEIDFVCPSCGKPLTKVDGRPTTPEPKKPNKGGNGGNDNKKMIIAIAVAAVVIIGGLIAWLCTGSDNKPQESGTVTIIDTSDQQDVEPEGIDEPQSDGETDGDGKEVTPPTPPTPPTTPTPPTQPKTVFGGAATLSGNVITFKRSYRLNLHSVDGDYIDIPAGAKIITCKFDGNNLIQGELVINNESRLLSGIKERL